VIRSCVVALHANILCQPSPVAENAARVAEFIERQTGHRIRCTKVSPDAFVQSTARIASG